MFSSVSWGFYEIQTIKIVGRFPSIILIYFMGIKALHHMMPNFPEPNRACGMDAMPPPVQVTFISLARDWHKLFQLGAKAEWYPYISILIKCFDPGAI